MLSASIPLVAAGIGAAAALLTTAVTGVLRWRTDRRDQWWARAEWAMEKALSDDPKVRTVGIAVIEALLGNRRSRPDEDEMLTAVVGELERQEGSP